MKLAAAGALMLFARSVMGKGCPDGQIGVGTVQTCLIVNNMQTQCSATQGVVFGEGNCDQADIENMFQKDGYCQPRTFLHGAKVFCEDDDMTLLLREDVGLNTSLKCCRGQDALVVISLDAEDVSEGTTGEEDDDELTASGVTAGSDEIDVILLDISAELYDVDDISVKDEDDDGSTEVTVTNDALCWVEEGAVLEEDTALQSPNPFWQQLPHLLPLQVCPPKVAPHLALVETRCEVAEALIIGWVVVVDGSTKILEGPAGVALQEPNLVWQPDPQYALLLPQYPYWEQQLPNTLPKQVWLEPTPHLPLVEVFSFEGVGEEDDVGGCFDGEEDVEQEPKPDWHPLEM
ncbi:hypothetical protein J4E82_003547 [Alternaria postmessia]|uniref:uncharacterized protein n=1 Tax=Alternaria postmessia TaxID=1187938 RepID=UPI002224A923|nr:uncharacterized protein J4E82_003547 [Alternaria postmessia]KAI5377803.1 hypothetical protein J4E82_003547 [Alternaria postmessia]